MRYKSGMLFIVLASVLFGACSKENDIVVLKLGHSLATSHSVHKAMLHMAARLDEISAGQMRIDVYPSGQLGGERETVELVQIGSLAMTKVSAAPLEGFVPAMQIFSIPYVFRDRDHFYSVLDSSIGKELLAATEVARLRGMGYYDAGSRSFYTADKPVRSPQDLAGLKIRVQKSQTAVKMVKALGGSPTPISWGELYTALQQGVVDGAENNPPSFYLSGHYETCKYYALDEHTSVPDILLMSSRIWHDLSTEQQSWLQVAVDDSVIYQRKLWQQATEEALAAVIASGVEVSYPDKLPFQQAVIDMKATYDGTDVADLMTRIDAVE